jgi:bifunctional DNA-binding transcriptional regulator/antitoxin component of YhaV-PrlF toxin-antitoxin module
MKETAIVELDNKGSVVLPEEIRRDLPAGTHFLVRRQEHNIILVALPSRASASFDLSAEAFDFANELTAEGYDDYLAQVALTNPDQAS